MPLQLSEDDAGTLVAGGLTVVTCGLVVVTALVVELDDELLELLLVDDVLLAEVVVDVLVVDVSELDEEDPPGSVEEVLTDPATVSPPEDPPTQPAP